MHARLYHNPRCSKSRSVLAYLQQQGLEIDIIPYMTDRLGVDDLQRLARLMGIQAREWLRRSEKAYQSCSLAEVRDEEKIFLSMHKYPELIERPIVEINGKAVLARPLERLVEFLDDA